MTKQERISNGKKTVSKEVLGELNSNIQKNETRPLSYTIHKNKLKMDEEPECETGNHQNFSGESRKKISLTSAAAISYLIHPQGQGN